MIEYTGRKIERRSKDRKPLKNEFTKQLMRAVNRNDRVVIDLCTKDKSIIGAKSE